MLKELSITPQRQQNGPTNQLLKEMKYHTRLSQKFCTMHKIRVSGADKNCIITFWCISRKRQNHYQNIFQKFVVHVFKMFLTFLSKNFFNLSKFSLIVLYGTGRYYRYFHKSIDTYRYQIFSILLHHYFPVFPT